MWQWWGKLAAIILAAKAEQHIAETCKMLQSFTCIFKSKVFRANGIFYSVSTIYCSFHSASHSCGSDDGSLQPSLWLSKLSSILQKLAKCSTALHRPLGFVPVDFSLSFCNMLLFPLYEPLMWQWWGKLTAIIMAANVKQYIADTCKMQHSFTCIFTSKVFCANRICPSVSTIYCSFHSASHSCAVTREDYSHHYGFQRWAVYCRNSQSAAELCMHLRK